MESKKPKTRLDTLKALTNSQTRGRVRRLRKFRELKKQLDDFVQQLVKKGVIDQTFLNFIQNVEDQKERIKAEKEILSRKDLTPSDLYEISKIIEDEPLKKEAQEKYVAIAPENDLDDTIKYEDEKFQEIAWQERCERIKKGLIKKRRAREILIELFKDTPDYRIKIWDVLEWLEPTDKALQSLLILPFMDKLPELSAKIERLVRKKRRKPDNTKLLSKIQNIQKKLKELKEGQ